MLIAVHNPSGMPQVATEDGRIVGAGEFVAIERDARTVELLEQRFLTEVKGVPAEDMHPDARLALEWVARDKADRAASKSTSTSTSKES
jgi:hypothetical protein